MPDAPVHAVMLVGGPKVAAPDGSDLRQVLLRSGVSLYGPIDRLLHCGGRGRCRTCRVTIRAGHASLSPTTPHEARVADLLPDERLACQAAVRGPVTLEVSRSIRRGF